MTALPDSIIQNGLFCCWKYEERNGRKTKVPYQPETGLGAKSNDPSSFVPYKTAVQASGYDGIGIGIFNGICAIDLDNCVSDSGYYTPVSYTHLDVYKRQAEYGGIPPIFPAFLRELSLLAAHGQKERGLQGGKSPLEIRFFLPGEKSQQFQHVQG